MSDDAVKTEKALSGERTFFTLGRFEIKEDMIIEFEGWSCLIRDANGTAVGAYGEEDGKVTEGVHDGYICNVMYGNVSFKKS